MCAGPLGSVNTCPFLFRSNASVKSKLENPPGHLTPLPAREGGHLITTHRGGGGI